MKIAARGLSDPGQKRDQNQDSFCINEELRLYVVADGMGGHAGGGTASQLAVQAIEERLLSAENDSARGAGREPHLLLSEAVREACRQIYRRAQDDPSLTGMGTTVTALRVGEGVAYVAHVGDSRCYLARRGHVYQVTEDHSLVNEQLKTGAITAEEARHSRFRNIITRSVGFEEDVKVDSMSLPLEPGDRLVLCSDGLSNLVQDEEILELVSTVAPEDAPGKLIELANDRGGDDNITVIVVRAEKD